MTPIAGGAFFPVSNNRRSTSLAPLRRPCLSRLRVLPSIFESYSYHRGNFTNAITVRNHEASARTSHEDNGPHFIAWRCDRSELSIHVAGFDEQTDGEMLLSWSPEVGVEIGEAHDTRTFWRTLGAPSLRRAFSAPTARNRLHPRISAAISSENSRILRVNWSAMSSNLLATCCNLLII